MTGRNRPLSAPIGRDEPSSTEALAEGFAQHLVEWSQRLGGDSASLDLLRAIGAALSRATRQGHVCLLLDEWRSETPSTPDRASLRAALLASRVVGTPECPGALPLIVDGADRLYLHRYFDYERRLARRLTQAAAAPPTPPAPQTGALLAALFAANAAAAPDDEVDWQKLAAALALRGRLTVISGGPGTGKTTTVVNLLACMVAQNPAIRIALAAPTGKAAARMIEAIAQRAAHLPEDLRSRLPGDASTVHRLLGVSPSGAGFVHHAGRPLAIDALVVDEASMLDLALATQLFEAVPPDARIILLGDKDQLAAVESGAVFADLSADPALSDAARVDLAALMAVDAAAIAPAAVAQPGALADTVVWFSRNFRFAAASAIGRLAGEIRTGHAAAAQTLLRLSTDPALRWIDPDGTAVNSAHAAGAVASAVLAGYAGYLDRIRTDPGDAAAITRAFGEFRVLCALHDGAHGVAAINELMTRHALKQAAALRTGADAASDWYPGRPVMVLRNDYTLRLFNGDVGIALPDAEVDGALRVWFPTAEGRFRKVPPVRLPAHQTAFALTVHKSQGSEFDAVLVLLTARRSPVLTRELLYTAVTRARRSVTLAGAADVIAAAIETPTRRRSGLRSRLIEARAGVDGRRDPLAP